MPSDKEARLYQQKLSWHKSQRQNHEETVQEISDLCMPFRGDITTRRAPGDRRKPLFDPIASIEADRMTNFLAGSLFDASSKWINMVRVNTILHEDRVDRAMYATDQRMLQALSDSNFYVAAHAWVKDWGVLGSGTLCTEHDDSFAVGSSKFGGLRFEAVPWARAWWQFGSSGRPLSIAIEHEFAAIAAVQFFDRQADRVPQRVRDLAKSHPYEDVCFYRFVEWDKTNKKKPWKTTWLCEEGGAIIVRKSFAKTPKYIPARMMVLDGEQYGRGRGHIARPMAKGVNEIARQEVLALGMHLNPMFLSEDDTMVQYDFAPGGHITVRPPKEMRPDYLQSGTDFNVVELIKQNYHRGIKEAFLGDALGEPETQERSAAATRDRQARALARLSATSHTVIYEMLRPLVNNVLNIMLDKGALPELSEVLKEDPDLIMDTTFSSPFFTAQKEAAANRVYGQLERRLQLFERSSDPAWLEDIDQDAIRQLEKELSDVPATMYLEQETVDEKRGARADQNADSQLSALLDRAQRSQTQVQLRPGQGRGGGGGLLG